MELDCIEGFHLSRILDHQVYCGAFCLCDRELRGVVIVVVGIVVLLCTSWYFFLYYYYFVVCLILCRHLLELAY